MPVNWTASIQPYTNTGGFTFNHIASGQLVLPQDSPYAQSGYLWWSKSSNQLPIVGNNWWNDLEAVGDTLELDNLGILSLTSPNAAFDYYLIFPKIEPTVFKTNYSFPFYSTVKTDDFDPTDFGTIGQFIKSDYQNLERFSTNSYESNVSTQITELVHVRKQTETPCEDCYVEPPPPCQQTNAGCNAAVPEPSQILGALVFGLALVYRVLKRAW